MPPTWTVAAVGSETVALRPSKALAAVSPATALSRPASFEANVAKNVFWLLSAVCCVVSWVTGIRSCAIRAFRTWLKSMLLKPLSVIGELMTRSFEPAEMDVGLGPSPE